MSSLIDEKELKNAIFEGLDIPYSIAKAGILDFRKMKRKKYTVNDDILQNIYNDAIAIRCRLIIRNEIRKLKL